MVIRVSDKKQNYNNVTKLLVKPKTNASKASELLKNRIFKSSFRHA